MFSQFKSYCVRELYVHQLKTSRMFAQSKNIQLTKRQFSTTNNNNNNINMLNKPLPAEDPELLGKYAKKPATSDKSGEATSNVNPVTGEINGPKGPEPTRYVSLL